MANGIARLCAPHGLLLPKVGSAETVQNAEAVIKEAGAPDNMALWCMIETPLGVLHEGTRRFGIAGSMVSAMRGSARMVPAD